MKMIGIDKLEMEVSNLKSYTSFREYVLYEAKQVGHIYHFTTPTKILDILKSGKIAKGNEGYVSLTRDFQLPYEKGYFNTGEYIIRITIDGDKLSNNVKINPISDVRFSTDEREEGVLNEINSKYFKYIDILTTDNRIFPKSAINAVFEKCKDHFKNTKLIKKFQPVKD